MLIKTYSSALPLVVYKIILLSQDIVKNIMDPDGKI